MKTLLVTGVLPCLLLFGGCNAWLLLSSSSQASAATLLRRPISLSSSSSAASYNRSWWLSSSSSSSPQSTTTRLNLAPPNEEVIMQSSLSTVLIAEITEEWRQYVPLVVSCLVILDILLGSPAANSVLNIIRSQSTTDEEQDESVQESIQESRPGGFLQNYLLLQGPAVKANKSPTTGTTTTTRSTQSPATANNNNKERIDSNAFAQAAIEKAQATLELRNYLDARKTDWDRMEEIKREMDQQLEELDEKQKKRQRTEE